MLGLSALLLFSCSNEDFLEQGGEGNPSDHINFGIAREDATPPTKGSTGTETYTAASYVLRSAQSADTLCMRATVTDGIQTGRQAVTRGKPVSTGDFHDKFHVLCQRDDETSFFMDVDVTEQTDGSWASDEIYYWQGANHMQTFYAWAPVDGAFAKVPTAPNDMSFTYTVPAEADKQQDLVVAEPQTWQGNHNQQVIFNFQHICTAVKFTIGSQMQAGTIRSVTLKGVRDAGTYNYTGGNWQLDGTTTADFTQQVDMTTSGSEQEGTAITQPEYTFMMLPQTLPQGAMVEVIFTDNTTGQDRTLSASIGGSEWPMGKTVTYRLSITPEYEFDLSTPEKERVLDAHYEIFLTNLVVSGLPEGTPWSISGPGDLDGVIHSVTIQAQKDMNSYARQGYWTDHNLNASGTAQGSARGESEYAGTSNGTFPIAIFVPENLGDAERTITLNITLNNTDDVVQTLTLTQLAPSWYGNGIGCERIEGAKSPWGFYWSEDFALVYDLTGSSDENARESLRQYVEWTKTLHTLANIPFIGAIIRWIFGDDIPDLGFVDMEKSLDIWGVGGIADKITINLGRFAETVSQIALSETDGVANTKEMYNFEGFQLVNEIINRIESIPGYTVTTVGEGANPQNNAAIACMKLNGWDIIYHGDGALLKLVGGDNANPSWYLPAINEAQGIKDETYPLAEDHWSSTAVTGSNEQSYKYSADGSRTAEHRRTELSIRAVCKKP